MSEPSENARMSLAAETDFGLNLLGQVANNSATVFSPLSVALALSLVHAGARGKTRKQIGDSILNGFNDTEVSEHFSSLMSSLSVDHHAIKFSVANRAFINKKFELLDSYLEEIDKLYNASAEKLDFQQQQDCANTVNGFVENKTNGLIKKMVSKDSFSEDTALILINAFYFKAPWAKTFSESATNSGDFYVSEGVTKKVDFMRNYAGFYLFAENDHVQVVSFPYKGRGFAFNVFLPKERYGLEAARKVLTGTEMTNLLTNMSERQVNVALPKFKLEAEFDLKDILSKLGITDMFTEGAADLSGIGDNLVVSKVVHKAVIEIDENGTEAAAATTVEIQLESMMISRDPVIEFEADHPFIFSVTFNYHILFAGQYHG